MQVTKIMPSEQSDKHTTHKFTEDQLQVEFGYMQAEKVTKKLLEKGLITREEFELIMAKKRGLFLHIYHRLFDK